MLNGRQEGAADQDRPAAQTSPGTRNGQAADERGAVSPPSISLPRGGGAIRGIGEKFAANPVTGTGSTTVPIATSAGRAGFGPQLALAYDSGAGNGPFGLGWSLSLPAITRKTDKGLPRYDDAAESDEFILSGAEDLVPVLVQVGGGWQRPEPRLREAGGTTYRVETYRPRIEGLFARIERWTNLADPADVHWRSISGDNILTLYGKDRESRIADPVDPARIFAWLICETRDDKGNAVLYEYQAEDGRDLDLSQAHEANRGGADDPHRQVNRYLKRVRYGNRVPLLVDGRRPSFLAQDQMAGAGWMFEVVFDYDEGHVSAETIDGAGQSFVAAGAVPTRGWSRRPDPFSAYRAGFEVRTYRLCRRVLMFHHFPDEPDVGADCLVRSTDLTYAHELSSQNPRHPTYSFLQSVSHSGYVRQGGSYLKRSLPPVEFEYSQPVVQVQVEEVDAASLENLPVGLDGAGYQWLDLHGEGIPGILTEQAGAWFYKRNTSPINVREHGPVRHVEAQFSAVEVVAARPNASLGAGAQFMDLAGDGRPDLVVLDGPLPGLYEHDGDAGWNGFRPFKARLNRAWGDPNLRLVDLNGDGHADVLVTEDDALMWHPSLAEDGFGPAQRVQQAMDEEKGPRLVLADGSQSIYLADLDGDGLSDLARVRNGEVSYWPNLGYGRFGARVAMDNAPTFDTPDQFDQARIRLADVDGSGTTDIIYLHRDGVRLYFNQSGNGWGSAHELTVFPRVDNLVDIQAADLLGNGTACLVWSSPLPGDGRRPMRYVNLMGENKPHLLVKTVNNLGAETRVRYAPSTQFYLQDRRDGRPWITRLPFPVHVVERVETYDHLSRNRFVTRYAYHHGYFDGEEREFRGFGLVEQFDTETFASLTESGELPVGDNVAAASHVPAVLTRTWFHTGVYLGRDRVSRFFAGLRDGQDRGEYYREPAWLDDDLEAEKRLLPDSILPGNLSVEEEREAARSLKGTLLRQEVYALDSAGRDDDFPYGHPYTVTEQNTVVRLVQGRGANRHAVFFTHSREAITYHYERNPADPRVQHALTLEVDAFGNVLKAAAAGYGRRLPDPALPLDADRERQTRSLVTYTENGVTVAIDDPAADPDNHRAPLLAEARTYELTGYTPTGEAGRYRPADFVQIDSNDPARLAHVFDAEIEYEEQPTAGRQRRLIEHVRTLYRPDDLGAAQGDPEALLPPGTVQPLAVPGETYRLAFTPGLLAQVFRRDGQPLLPDPAAVLGGTGPDRGGYVDLDGDGRWWIPTGRVFLSPGSADTAAQELDYARRHFFPPLRSRDPFGQTATATLDAHDLLLVETLDPLGNRVTVGERLADGSVNPNAPGNDYRVLQPRLVTDPNRNRSMVAFDALGLVAGTALMGKAEESVGDSLALFDPDLTGVEIDAFFTAPDPHLLAPGLLRDAGTRVVYDLDRFFRTRQAHPHEPEKWQPACAATLARETHAGDPPPPGGPKIQLAFSYSDGFGREIQRKMQAEPGPVPQRGPDGEIILGANGQPVLTPGDASPRWVGSGWTVFNNKGNPVRQYEPFFTDRHAFEFDVRIGVSPVLFYDPVGRVVATLHPNHTYEKVVFDAWQQTTYDVNDSVTLDPGADEDVQGFFVASDGTPRLPAGEFLPTWHALRTDPAHAAAFADQYPDAAVRANETSAAIRAALHADTPAVGYLDALGRPFLSIAHNRFQRENANGVLETVEERHSTRVELDIEGNELQVLDALVRLVMRYDHDLLGSLVHQASMEAGERWVLTDAAGQAIRTFDSRGFERRMTYDELRRPAGLFVIENGVERLAERTVYGEALGDEANHRARVHQVFDAAGVVTSEVYDFKGNLLRGKRELLPDYKQAVDWSQGPAADDGEFGSSITYDALDRPLTVTTPDGSIHRPGYNQAGLLERLEVSLRGEAPAEPFVTNVNYDARGRRVLVDYGNGAETTYDYDPLTFRLVRLRTTRPATPDPTAPRLFADPTVVQDLRYTYDPAGNITRIEDAALKTVNHANQRVEPVCSYTYDALYRLIETTGREHIGQTGFDFSPPHGQRRDFPFIGRRAAAGDPQALRHYTETCAYDMAGNLDRVRHSAQDGSWTRSYSYEEESLIQAGQVSNRLTRTTVGNGVSHVETYRYADAQGHDVHGCTTAINDIELAWDFEDQLHEVRLGGGGAEYYVYDAAGQRVRKVMENQNGARQEERLYLGGFEVYREHLGAHAGLVRETLHVMDDRQRIALVETRNGVDDGTPRQVIRYQLDNHLGSASLELAADAALISYEEYHPYGTTAFQAVRGDVEVAAKRYRYTGMERDEKSGLEYHGARYYAPWLRRWTSPDPAGFGDGLGLYTFTRHNPVRLHDPSGTQSVGDLVEYGSVKGQGRKIHQLHFFPESLQKKLVPKWSRSLSKAYKEKVYIGTAKLNKSVDVKIAKYLNSIDSIRDEKHVLQIIRDVKDIWVQAGVPRDIVDKWSLSAVHTARKIGFTKRPVPRGPSVKRRTPSGDVSDATKSGGGMLGKVGKVVKVVAIAQGVLVAGEAAAHVWNGDFGKAADVIGSFAYDQTIGTVADAASWVASPVTSLLDSIDALEKMREEQDAILEQFFGDDEDDAPAPEPSPTPSAPARPAPKKPDRRSAAQGLYLLFLAIALAAHAPENAPVTEEASPTEIREGEGGPRPTVVVGPQCPFWTPTGIPFGNPPCIIFR